MLIDMDFVKNMRPAMDPNAHKGTMGRVLLFCGSVGYTGAARLAAGACVRSGAGLITLCAPREIYPILAASCPPEVMCRPLPDDGSGRLGSASFSDALAALSRCNALLIGPGLGRSEDMGLFVTRLLEKVPCPVVIDADGITAVAPHIHIQRTCPLILTPHDGEFARLGGDLSDPNRARATCTLSDATGAIVVRKGPGTVTAWPGGSSHQNTSGGPALAHGGSGDVLAGLMTGLLAQYTAAPHLWPRADLPGVVAAAVFLHGLAADRAAAQRGVRALTPSDLIDALPEAIRLCFEAD